MSLMPPQTSSPTIPPTPTRPPTTRKPTLFGWPHAQTVPGALCALGVPTDLGNAIARGAAEAPAAIRHASLALEPSSLHGCDLGDLAVSAATDAATLLARLETAVMEIANAGACPLLLGGDHSITYAPVSALSRARELCLVWFDAHTDFSPWSGDDAHNHKQVLRRISDLPNVRRIVQIGYRGFTAGDERNLGEDARVIVAAQARTLDAASLLRLLPEQLPCYVSIDIDAIDPLWAPGTAAPVADGLLPEIVATMLRSIVRHRRVIGADVVEVNPSLDAHGQTSRIAAELIREIAAHWSCQRAFDGDACARSSPEPFVAVSPVPP